MSGNKGESSLSWHRKILLPGVIVLATVILSDAALRVTLGLGNPILYQYSPRAGYVLAPNQKTFRFLAWNRINRWGMRCPNFTLTRPKGTYRVMFIGDSVTYGTTFVDQSKIFTSRLAKLLPKIMHRPVQVLNASCGAWAPGNEVGYLESRGTYNADLVIFVVNTGDLIQPFNIQILSPDSPYPNKGPFCAISELWFRYLWPRIRGRLAFRDAGSYIAETPTGPPPDVERLFTRARSRCASSGARMAIVYEPFRGDQWSEPPFPHDEIKLKKWCAEDRIPFLSLNRVLAPHPSGLVYYGGVHLKPYGNKLAAAAIADAWPRLCGSRPSGPRRGKDQYAPKKAN